MAPAPNQTPDLYEVLQVHPNASQAMIRKAYGWLAKEYHPDKNPDRKDWAETRMKALNEAFETLSDPSKRKTYNLTYAGPLVEGSGRARPRNGARAWSAETYEGEPNFNAGRTRAEREARRARYYTGPDEAYATADAPPGSAAYEQRRGQDYIERKNYERAIRHYKRALNIDDENPELMVELGMAYYLNLNLVSAREWLERAVGMNPALADAHYMLGMISLDEAVLQAAERDQQGRPLFMSRSQRRYFVLLGRAVEHFEKALYLSPMMFKKQFTFFPTRKSISEFAAADVRDVKSPFEFTKHAEEHFPLRQALIDWYFDHAQNAFTSGSGSDGEFFANVKRLMPKQGAQMFLNSWAYAALNRGLALYPDELALLKAYEKLLAQGNFLGEQPMSRDLTAELKRARSDTFVKIRGKDTSYSPATQVAAPLERWTVAFVLIGMVMVVFFVWQLVAFITELL